MLSDALLIAASEAEGVSTFLKWLGTASGSAVAGGCVWLVYTGRLVLKREIDLQIKLLADKTKECEEWKAQALRSQHSAERAVNATEQAVAVTAQIASTK